MLASGLTFGIYPFGIAGMEEGVASGAPDDVEQIGRALEELSGGKPLLPHSYVLYSGSQAARDVLDQVALYAQSGIRWDIVLCFRDPGMELDGWISLIRTIVQRFGTQLEALQITGEPNLTNMPGSGDGSQPNVRQALLRGVTAAKQEVLACGASVKIGFNAVPTFDPNDDFWPSLKELGTREFANALDYVGYDFYPDVFGPPIPLEGLASAVAMLLRQFRTVNLPAAGIPASVPIRITENGWPTGPNRSEEKQAQILEVIIRAVYAAREEFNVTHYELFGLRDADSSNENLFYRFGIVRDDYVPKPAFDTYRRMIAELG